MSKKKLAIACGGLLLLVIAAMTSSSMSLTLAVAKSPSTPQSASELSGGPVAQAQSRPAKSSTSQKQPGSFSSSSDSPEVRFELARTCHEAATNKKSWELQLKICHGASDLDFAKRCSANVAGFDQKVRAADLVLAQCSQVPAEIEEDFYRSSIEAAKAGDATAQLCYLESNFDLKRPFGQDELAYYHSVDANYVNAAINRGDWRMIVLMSRSYGGAARHSTMRRELTGGDPFTLYQMNRLLSLGADGAYKDYVVNRANDAKSELTSEQIDKADEWVAMAYEKHFASSPRLTQAPTICESP